MLSAGLNHGFPTDTPLGANPTLLLIVPVLPKVKIRCEH